MYHQDFKWESVETEEKDEKGNKKKKNQKKFLNDEKGEQILALGQRQPNLAPKKGGSIEFYTCTWQLETKNERIKDENGNDKVITTTGKEMLYNKTKGFLNDQKLYDWFLNLEKQFNEFRLTVDKTADKAYLWILTNEMKPPKTLGQYAEHTCNIDAFVMPK